jgi:hypothetical protein
MQPARCSAMAALSAEYMLAHAACLAARLLPAEVLQFHCDTLHLYQQASCTRTYALHHHPTHTPHHRRPTTHTRPTHPTHPQGKDGGKFLCALSPLKPPCIIYSLGSRMDFSFEEDMLRTTQCQVHTFDCTVVGKVLDPQRHVFHKLCIGSAGPPGKRMQRKLAQLGNVQGTFESYGSVTKRLGHNRVALLKMDIEGYEYQVGACMEWGWFMALSAV